MNAWTGRYNSPPGKQQEQKNEYNDMKPIHPHPDTQAGHRRPASRALPGILLAAFCLLAACSADETLPAGETLTGRAALQVQSVSVVRGDQPSTRAVTTTVYPTSSSVGFFVKADAAKGYTACHNRKGVYNAARSRWQPVPDSIWLFGQDAELAMYAPYDAAQPADGTLNLAATLRPADGSKDLWCKRFTANNRTAAPTLTLEHLYSRLRIEVKRSASYGAEASLTALKLTGNEVYDSAVYKPFETLPYTYGRKDVAVTFAAPLALTGATPTATVDLLLIPASLTDDVTLTFTVNRRKMRLAVAKATFAGSKLEAGKQYNAKLELRPSGLELTSVSVSNWDATLAEADEGCADFPGMPTRAIDIGLSFFVADGNLVGTKQADGTITYAFASEQGWYSKQPDGGDYFCWNELDPTNLDVSHPEWSDVRDPCRKVPGGRWHTPTQAQCEELQSADCWMGTWTMADKTTIKGMYVGIKEQPDSVRQGKSVFLPLAGFRADGNMHYYTFYGDYWSSQPLDNGNAYEIYFNADASSLGSYFEPRNTGRAIRCVADKEVL